ncbi:hypothetical protein O6H91_03G081500 [Diphasiastrum complanatum]|uniref:Uncharacterized protein n=1 Tax=Diphasiastrum complanatum TaxID=34168 RepID=A0ACC2E8L7_DIPCM|nr:hypothetical protein O6H91_03G081500 [Diphasiastrum complanatum]
MVANRYKMKEDIRSYNLGAWLDCVDRYPVKPVEGGSTIARPYIARHQRQRRPARAFPQKLIQICDRCLIPIMYGTCWSKTQLSENQTLQV